MNCKAKTVAWLSHTTPWHVPDESKPKCIGLWCVLPHWDCKPDTPFLFRGTHIFLMPSMFGIAVSLPHFGLSAFLKAEETAFKGLPDNLSDWFKSAKVTGVLSPCAHGGVSTSRGGGTRENGAWKWSRLKSHAVANFIQSIRHFIFWGLRNHMSKVLIGPPLLFPFPHFSHF